MKTCFVIETEFKKLNHKIKKSKLEENNNRKIVPQFPREIDEFQNCSYLKTEREEYHY